MPSTSLRTASYGGVYIDGFLPPADPSDDPRNDPGFPELVAAINKYSRPTEPIRVVETAEGIRLADQRSWAVWLACSKVGQGLKSVAPEFVQVVDGNSAVESLVAQPEVLRAPEVPDVGADEPVVVVPPEIPVSIASPEIPELKMKVGGLHPNQVNGKVFTVSLGDESVADLAEDIGRRGLSHPIEVRSDGTILDGERRWRAVRKLGWVEVPVAVKDIPDDDVGDYVFDAFSSIRHAAVEEQANLYKLALEVLQKRHGRPHGDQKHRDRRVCDLVMEAADIRTLAAKRAGFSSTRIAQYACKLFEEGAEELKAEVRNGQTSISAAYEKLMGHAKKASPDVNPPTEAEVPAANEVQTEPEQPAVVPEADAEVHAPEGHVEPDQPVAEPEVETAPVVPVANVRPEPDPPSSNPERPMVPEERQVVEPQPAPIDPKAAFTVIRKLLGSAKPEVATKLLETLASEARLDLVILGEDPKEALETLKPALTRALTAYANENPDAAFTWIDDLHDELSEVASVEYDVDDVDDDE